MSLRSFSGQETAVVVGGGLAGQPALVATRDGKLYGVVLLAFEGERVRTTSTRCSTRTSWGQ